MEDSPAPAFTILIVDDNPNNLELLSDVLTGERWEILVSMDGKSAIEQAEYAKPDLILLDVMMPKMDGFETCLQLKYSEETKDIPVIFMTALSETVDKVKGLSIGAVDYITKPFQSQELLARVKVHLQLRSLTKELSKQNTVLSDTLENLRATQSQLVESEKMAALGSLVAGVAHEVNTPIGIGVTAASLLDEKLNQIIEIYQEGSLKRSELENFLETAQQSSTIILSNLDRAANLIQSFKQVAVDRASESQRKFQLKAYIHEVLHSLQPKLKSTQHQVIVRDFPEVELNSYPGAFAQILTNLVLNSLIHAYEPEDAGTIAITLQQESDRVILEYTDDGRGISPENLSQIFDPFFTTKRGRGGTGLGLHIIYNLVTQKLQGTIECESEEGVGTKFTIELPLNLDTQSAI